MERVENLIHRVTGLFTALGAFFLLTMMCTVVANIIYRFFGRVIVGSYELVELMVLITVTFALAYAAVKKGHVVITILISRLPNRVQSVLEAITSLISVGTWGVIAWAAISMLLERWMSERTEMLSVPYLPFRSIWVAGLILLCLIYVIWIIKAVNKAVKK